MSYATKFSPTKTPQTEPIPGSKQVENSAGGYSFQVDKWMQLRRFLILGCEGGSYYANSQAMTRDNAVSVMECANEDAGRTVQEIVDVSVGGKAVKNDAAVFALALCCTVPSAKPLALAALSSVCRIGTHLFQFVDAMRRFNVSGRAFRTAVANWYQDKDAKQLAYQMSKYQSRDGMSHRDVLRLCRPSPKDAAHGQAYRWAVKGIEPEGEEASALVSIVAFEQAKRATTASEIVRLIQEHGLVREHIPTQFLNDLSVWAALLESMPLTAMIRNLGKMSSIGLVKPLSNAARTVAEKLADADYLHKSRVHPLTVVSAARVYAKGRGDKGSLSWTAVPQVIDALDGAFYAAFENVQPTGLNHLVGVDVSGSMGCSGPIPSMTCRDVAAVMAMVVARTEPNCFIHGFCHQFVKLPITARTTLTEAISAMHNLPFGGTDCALPMIYAEKEGLDVDAFIVLTDSETWAGNIHPCQALKSYRRTSGRNAKSVVVGMVSNRFSIADPNDGGMLDVVGCSTDTPSVIAEWLR